MCCLDRQEGVTRAHTGAVSCVIAFMPPHAPSNCSDCPLLSHTSPTLHPTRLAQGYKCDISQGKPFTVFGFFSIYIVLTSWVIMSLFIGVISMGMFESFQKLKEEQKLIRCAIFLTLLCACFT